MDIRVKDLKLDEIDFYIQLIDNSVNGRDNRVSKRTNVSIPMEFYIKGISGEYKKDSDQPAQPSSIVDISKSGAGVLTGRRFKSGDVFICKGNGENKTFIATLEVVNSRKKDLQFRYGCKIIKFDVTKQ